MASLTTVDLVLVEDDRHDAALVERLIEEYRSGPGGEERAGPIEFGTMEHVDRLAAGLEAVRADPPDVVLLDLHLPDSRGLETVEAMVEGAPTVPVVVLTGRDDADVGVEAIRRGAQDYLVKGTITAELLARTLRYAIERAHTQRELVDRTHRLALLNRIVRRDIRNDLSVIVGWGDQLRTDAEDDSPALEGVLEASRHALELTETAAEVMDVLAADADVRLEPCDLTAILDAELDRLRREEEEEVSIDVDRAGSRDEPVFVTASPMLESVFRHLLGNAATHTDREVPTIAVTITADDERATVSIADDGVGIPDDQKALLVDSEARFDDRSMMGPGLYLVTTLLEAFGGGLEIEDNVPRGTVVTVSLERAPLE